MFQKRIGGKKKKKQWEIGFHRVVLAKSLKNHGSSPRTCSSTPTRFHVKNWVSGSRGKDKLNSTLFCNFSDEKFFGEKEMSDIDGGWKSDGVTYGKEEKKDSIIQVETRV